MKNLYLYMGLLFLGITNAQNLQNAKWVFGYSAYVSFLTNPPTGSNEIPVNTGIPSPEGISSEEGCASVSDQNGNLLLYTNGKKIWHYWNNSFQIIATGLFGSQSSAQNAIIVPKPSVADHYYIFTIDGSSGEKKGLYYSEIDLSNGLGQVVFQNKILKDNFGTPIDSAYNNLSEAITSTICSDGNRYWVVAYITNGITTQILSYLVTANGVIDDIPTNNLNYNTSAPFCIKISPNSAKFALAGNSLTIGNFDSTFGTFTINSTITNVRPYGIEFSPSSSVIYYTKYLTNGQINIVDVNNPTIQSFITTGSYFCDALQLGIDGKIYVVDLGGNSYFLSTISDPNNFSNPQFSYHNISLLNRSSVWGLPQWVHWQHSQCAGKITLTSPIHDVNSGNTDIRQATIQINASNIIDNGASAIYHAAESVVLTNGFLSKSGSNLYAYIAGCEGRIREKTQSNESARNNIEDFSSESKINSDIYNILPNPNNGVFKIIMKDTSEQNIEILNSTGIIIYNTTLLGQMEYQINISDKPKGIYLVKITSGAKIYTKKIIKN